MALFPPWSDSVMSAVLIVVVVSVLLGVGYLWLYVRSPYNTKQHEHVAQPVMFDHRHHVGDDGIDCRYCHYTVERSPNAGVPPVALCMGCHGQIWSDSEQLEPVRAAYFQGAPLQWARVTSVPDYVYFDHSIHVARGVGCVSCHGRVDEMANVVKAESMTMGFCLDCHRDPAPRLRPKERITDLAWVSDEATGHAVASALGVSPPTNCTACHR